MDREAVRPGDHASGASLGPSRRRRTRPDDRTLRASSNDGAVDVTRAGEVIPEDMTEPASEVVVQTRGHMGYAIVVVEHEVCVWGVVAQRVDRGRAHRPPSITRRFWRRCVPVQPDVLLVEQLERLVERLGEPASVSVSRRASSSQKRSRRPSGRGSARMRATGRRRTGRTRLARPYGAQRRSTA